MNSPRCPACDGEGYVAYWAECVACQGHGRLWPEEEQACPACDEIGEDRFGRMCGVCGGHGVVVADDREWEVCDGVDSRD